MKLGPSASTAVSTCQESVAPLADGKGEIWVHTSILLFNISVTAASFQSISPRLCVHYGCSSWNLRGFFFGLTATFVWVNVAFHEACTPPPSSFVCSVATEQLPTLDHRLDICSMTFIHYLLTQVATHDVTVAQCKNDTASYLVGFGGGGVKTPLTIHYHQRHSVLVDLFNWHHEINEHKPIKNPSLELRICTITMGTLRSCLGPNHSYNNYNMLQHNKR